MKTIQRAALACTLAIATTLGAQEPETRLDARTAKLPIDKLGSVADPADGNLLSINGDATLVKQKDATRIVTFGDSTTATRGELRV